MLSALLSDRKAADEHLRDEIGRKTAEWGVSVASVEIRDVAIPVALQDAMSRQAKAEREKQAASFSVRPRPRSQASLSRRQRSTPITPLPCNYVR